MYKAYTKIDWGNKPKAYTSFGDTNNNNYPLSIDERIINMEEGEKDRNSIRKN